jgi:hypothetical protein
LVDREESSSHGKLKQGKKKGETELADRSRDLQSPSRFAFFFLETHAQENHRQAKRCARVFKGKSTSAYDRILDLPVCS